MPVLPKADPRTQAGEIAVAFAQGDDLLGHAAIDQAEDAGVGGNRHRGHGRHQPMEGGEERPLQQILLALRADGIDHVVAGPPLGQETGNGFGGVLHVGVHQHDGVAAGVGQAGLHGRLMAEVPRKMDHASPVAGGGQLVEHLRALVARAVVDEDNLVVTSRRLSTSAMRAAKNRQHFGFVVDRQHDAHQRLVTRRPADFTIDRSRQVLLQRFSTSARAESRGNRGTTDSIQNTRPASRAEARRLETEHHAMFSRAHHAAHEIAVDAVDGLRIAVDEACQPR